MKHECQGLFARGRKRILAACVEPGWVCVKSLEKVLISVVNHFDKALGHWFDEFAFADFARRFLWLFCRLVENGLESKAIMKVFSEIFICNDRLAILLAMCGKRGIRPEYVDSNMFQGGTVARQRPFLLRDAEASTAGDHQEREGQSSSDVSCHCWSL